MTVKGSAIQLRFVHFTFPSTFLTKKLKDAFIGSHKSPLDYSICYHYKLNPLKPGKQQYPG